MKIESVNDKIVCLLYGLNDDEINVVEEERK